MIRPLPFHNYIMMKLDLRLNRTEHSELKRMISEGMTVAGAVAKITEQPPRRLNMQATRPLASGRAACNPLAVFLSQVFCFPGGGSGGGSTNTKGTRVFDSGSSDMHS
jgi:hypothetical protein